MALPTTQALVTIAVIAITTMATRFIPFILFRDNKETPKFLIYLGKVLPPAIMGMLIVYGLKSTTVLVAPHGLPELIAVVFVAVIHKWKHNMILSIVGGTLLYMILLQKVFV